MSGGTFDYNQYAMNDISDELQKYLVKIDADKCYATQNENELDVLALKSNILHTIELLRVTRINVQRLDWLFAGDDGLETYFERIAEDLKEFE